VRREGKSYVHPLVVLITCPNEQEVIRIGVIAGKSVGGAVERNHTKRLLRESVRPWIERIEPGWDLLFLARQAIRSKSFTDIQDAVQVLMERARLVRKVEDAD
jgi:ribonuclease P protein component